MYREGFESVAQCLSGPRRYSLSIIRLLYKSISYSVTISNRFLSRSIVREQRLNEEYHLLWRRVIYWVATDVSEELIALIFRVEEIISARASKYAGGKVLLAASIFRVEEIYSSETPVATQQTARRHIPEDDILHKHRCENLKSYKGWMDGRETCLFIKMSFIKRVVTWSRLVGWMFELFHQILLRQNESKWMLWAGHVARMEEGIKVWEMLVENWKEERPMRLVRHGRIIFRGFSKHSVNWIYTYVVQGRVQRRALINTVLNPRVLWDSTS
jgi:hypothetical protein